MKPCLTFWVCDPQLPWGVQPTALIGRPVASDLAASGQFFLSWHCWFRGSDSNSLVFTMTSMQIGLIWIRLILRFVPENTPSPFARRLRILEHCTPPHLPPCPSTVFISHMATAASTSPSWKSGWCYHSKPFQAELIAPFSCFVFITFCPYLCNGSL